MEQDLICFIILSNDEAAYKNCTHCLDRLIVPVGMRVQYMRGDGYDGGKTAALCQTAMMASDAKYKIYMSDRVSITNPRFLSTTINAFRADETLGVLGVMGYSTSPFSDDFWTSAPIGAVTFRKDGKEKTAHYMYDEKNITPAKVLIPPILVTQYDVPWRQMFQGARYAVMALSLEHQRKGYKAAVLPQEAIWCSAEEISCDTPDDEMCFRLEYAPEIAGEFFVEPRGRNYHPQIDPQFDSMRKLLASVLQRGQRNDALQIMQKLNHYFYQYNQFFLDETIESAYKILRGQMDALYPEDVAPYEPDENCVLFYDGVGFDIRGLAAIYLKALTELGYKIIYVADASSKGKTPTLMHILENAPTKAEIVYLHGGSAASYSSAICQTTQKYRPARGFLYVDEVHSVGRLAFLRMQGLLTRYYISLGDHCYWSCPDSFDFVLEFRNWGASISHFCRRVPKEKIKIQPYYPFFDHAATFQGYPFERADGDFVVFSGGLLYKTFDEELTYYQLIAWMLRTFPHVKFWYAGAGNVAPLQHLQEQFPERVFHTDERKDLFQILEHIDMYLNTYPLLGGLMMQYSTSAGKPPLSLTQNPIISFSGFLLYDAETVTSFSSVSEWKSAVKKYITDENYRESLVRKMQNAVIAPKHFKNNLRRILEEGKSDFECSVSPIDLTELHNWYFGTFVRLWESGAYDTK